MEVVTKVRADIKAIDIAAAEDEDGLLSFFAFEAIRGAGTVVDVTSPLASARLQSALDV